MNYLLSIESHPCTHRTSGQREPGREIPQPSLLASSGQDKIQTRNSEEFPNFSILGCDMSGGKFDLTHLSLPFVRPSANMKVCFSRWSNICHSIRICSTVPCTIKNLSCSFCCVEHQGELIQTVILYETRAVKVW